MIEYRYHTPASQYLMPLPSSIETSDGTLKLHLGSAYAFDDELFRPLGHLLETQLGLNEGCEDLFFAKSKENLPEEAYTLKVTREQVVARASSLHGMFNAVQTIRQLYLAGNSLLPCCRIEDGPGMRWRGFMLDCSRHFFSVPEILKLIDAAALHHLSVFQWHLTDDQGWRFPVDGYPRLEEVASRRKEANGDYAGFYSEDDIRKVVAYAEERFVTVVPEMDVPGHCTALLAAYPQLGYAGKTFEVTDRWGILDGVLNVASPAADAFLRAAADSLCRLFPSPFIHLGGDEVPPGPWNEDPLCRARMEELGGIRPLASWFTQRLASLLHEHGRRLVVWDEAFSPDLPKDTVIMAWRSREAGTQAMEAGYDTVWCPKTDGWYLDYTYEDSPEEPGYSGRVSSMEMCSSLSIPENPHLLGAQANLWTEYVERGRTAEYMLYPRLSVLAEKMWNPAARIDEDRLRMEKEKLADLGIQYRI